MNEWIKWYGGKCPVDEGALVDVKYRDGRGFTRVPALTNILYATRDAGQAYWRHDSSVNDIVAYRLSTQEEAYEETDKPVKASSGTKYDGGKVPLGLLSSIALTEEARVLAFGAKKYSAHNWRGGMDWSRVYDAVQRHLVAWNEGEDNDPETGLSHLAHARCGLGFLVDYSVNHRELDDRYKRGEK